jgi:hypothetical protein
MVLDTSPEELIKIIGHDGSRKLWPELPEPNCYQGFHLTEILFAALHFGRAGIFSPTILYSQSTSTPEEIGIATFDPHYRGIYITTNHQGNGHACAFNGPLVFDPAGRVCSKFDIGKIDAFILFFKVNPQRFPPMIIPTER